MHQFNENCNVPASAEVYLLRYVVSDICFRLTIGLNSVSAFASRLHGPCAGLPEETHCDKVSDITDHVKANGDDRKNCNRDAILFLVDAAMYLRFLCGQRILWFYYAFADNVSLCQPRGASRNVS